jgi:hypothetical protein
MDIVRERLNTTSPVMEYYGIQWSPFEEMPLLEEMPLFEGLSMWSIGFNYLNRSLETVYFLCRRAFFPLKGNTLVITSNANEQTNEPWIS